MTRCTVVLSVKLLGRLHVKWPKNSPEDFVFFKQCTCFRKLSQTSSDGGRLQGAPGVFVLLGQRDTACLKYVLPPRARSSEALRSREMRFHPFHIEFSRVFSLVQEKQPHPMLRIFVPCSVPGGLIFRGASEVTLCLEMSHVNVCVCICLSVFISVCVYMSVPVCLCL